MMDPEKIVDGISKEILTTLAAMEKATTSEDKLNCSLAIKNLCDSLSVFFDFASEMTPLDGLDDDIPF